MLGMEGTRSVAEKQAGEGLMGSSEEVCKQPLQNGDLMKTVIKEAEVAVHIAAGVAGSIAAGMEGSKAVAVGQVDGVDLQEGPVTAELEELGMVDLGHLEFEQVLKDTSLAERQ